MSNELKSAALTIKKEIQNLKQYVSDWQDHHDIVLSNLNSSSEKAFQDLSKSFLSSNNLEQSFIDFEENFKAVISKNANDLIDVNKQFTKTIKPIVSLLDTMADPYISQTNSLLYSTKNGKRLTNYLKNLAVNFLNDNLVSINHDKELKKILKKLTDITSMFRDPYKNEAEFTNRLAYAENFLNVFNSVQTDPILEQLFPKKSKNSNIDNIFSNSTTSINTSGLYSRLMLNIVNKKLDEILAVDSSTIEALQSSYGNAFNDKSFNHAKEGFKGVLSILKNSTSHFNDLFTEDIRDSLFLLYTNDMKDHLNLTKSCFAHDVINMRKNYSMDTASRDAMTDNLHSYLNSEEFFDEIAQAKKTNSKKNRP